MKLRYLTAVTVSVLGVALSPSIASAQDNPLLQQAENPLLQQADPGADALFEQQARQIDAAATKEPSHPTCVNIRTNYSQKMAEITEKSGQSSLSLSGIGRMSSNSRSAGYRIQNISRNITGKSSGAVGSATGAIGKGASVASDAAAIGSLLGFSGKKMSEKKARKKVAKLDAQAMDAVRQTGCPMATFS